MPKRVFGAHPYVPGTGHTASPRGNVAICTGEPRQRVQHVPCPAHVRQQRECGTRTRCEPADFVPHEAHCVPLRP